MKTAKGSKTVEPIRDHDKIAAIKAMLRDRPRDYLLFVLGINTALRISDLLAIRVGDVVDQAGQVVQSFRISERKTSKTKTVTLNQTAREALEWYFGQVGDLDRGSWLFESMRSDKPLDKVQVWRMINSWCERVGVDGNCGTHTLRKTWGYWARKSGIGIELIQAKFNHSSPSITRRYIGINDDEIAAVENAVNI
jgi:integrase